MRNVTELSVNPTGPSLKLLATHSLSRIGGRIDQAVASTRVGDFLYVLGGEGWFGGCIKIEWDLGRHKQIQTFDVKAAVPDLPISVQGMAVFVK